jgi:hypothetical protein
LVIRSAFRTVWTGTVDGDGVSRRSFSSHRTLVRALALGFGIVVGEGSGACNLGAFVCSNDDECLDGGRAGLCELDGYCSFAEEGCASGRAYGSHAPSSLAGECVASEPAIEEGSTDESGDDESGGDESGDDESGEAARRLHDGTDASTTGTSTGGSDDTDASTTDLDVGPCGSCLVDDDCSEGACEDGTCRVRETIAIDWVYDCTAGDFEPLATLPAGNYQATALPSAGSKWNDDDAVGGLTWAWWIECEEVSFADMRSPLGQWYATADDAFAAVVDKTTVIDHPGGSLSCGLADNICADNRGGVTFELVSACD